MKIKVILASSSQEFVKSQLEDRKKSLAAGTEIWQSQTLGTPWFPEIYSAPAVSEDYLYYGTFGLCDASTGTTGGFSIVNRQSGLRELPIEWGSFRSPVCAGDTVYVVGDCDGNHQVLE